MSDHIANLRRAHESALRRIENLEAELAAERSARRLYAQQLSGLIQEMSIEKAVSAPAPSPEPEQTPPVGGTSGRVLYIEDQITNVQVVKLMLDRVPGMDFFSAETGRLGLRQAVELRPDLILLDLNLPDMHGSEVMRELRSNAATEHIPVLVLSGDAAPTQIDRLLAAGARDYLVKPFKMDRLQTAVETLLREANVSAA